MTIDLQLRRATQPSQRPARDSLLPDTRDRVAQDAVTPFISNYMSAALFGVARGQLAVRWAEDIGSPSVRPTTGDRARRPVLCGHAR